MRLALHSSSRAESGFTLPVSLSTGLKYLGISCGGLVGNVSMLAGLRAGRGHNNAHSMP